MCSFFLSPPPRCIEFGDGSGGEVFNIPVSVTRHSAARVVFCPCLRRCCPSVPRVHLHPLMISVKNRCSSMKAGGGVGGFNLDKTGPRCGPKGQAPIHVKVGACVHACV